MVFMSLRKRHFVLRYFSIHKKLNLVSSSIYKCKRKKVLGGTVGGYVCSEAEMAVEAVEVMFAVIH